ncbi:MAG: calcium-binding protein, partial [Methylovulum sp.]|nr:calcium-binding protein [Methylovulum sp.]
KGTGTATPPTAIDFAVSLKTQPLRDVTLNFASSDSSEGVVNPVKLTFTADNWSKSQKLIVTGVNDYLNDGNVHYRISTTVKTIDVKYQLVTVPPIELTNRDDGRDMPLEIYGDKGGSKNDILVGKDGADQIYGKDKADDLSGGIGNDTLYGGYGNDNLFGNDGADTLWGQEDEDHLEGGKGNDTLDGGLGKDTMTGGVGNDTYYLGYDAVDVINDQGLMADVDTVIMPYKLSSYTLPNGIENGTISAGADTSSLTGNSSDNTLQGNDGKNTLTGAVGRDSLFGGLGDDVLSGGIGIDALTGGLGKDSFLFNTPLMANVDKIADFKPIDDTIKLENQIFVKLTSTGVLAVNVFVTATTAQDSNDFLVYNKATGALFYDADGNGAGAAVQIATLGVNLGLTNADFVVV